MVLTLSVLHMALTFCVLTCLRFSSPFSSLFLSFSHPQVKAQIMDAGFYVDVDDSTKQLNKKVREAQLAQYNYILVVGAKEQENGSVAG